MFARCTILAALIAAGSAGTAQARIDCDSIDAVWNSAAIVRQLQTSTDDVIYQRNLLRLEMLIAEMSQPNNPLGGAAPEDQAKIGEYAVTLEAALAAARSGRRDMASTLFGNSLSPAFARSLATLDEDGDCSQVEFDSTFQADQFMAATPMAGDDNIREIKLTPGSLAGSGEALADQQRTLPSVDGYQGPRFRPGVLFKGDLAVFFGMILALLALPAFIYWRRWAANYQTREARRVLQSPASVLLDQTRRDMIIVDISMNGMKLDHGGAINSHKRLNVQLAGRWILGHIRWQNASYAGIQFDRPIDPDTLSAVMGAGQNA
ncbi:PilZ domain-containing protein [Algimonas porphyrae]|uniref:PilZ domain-containing protein n=1 Tax=Algimonas porphyrae TaxID=1128113 RepID=A0ABQ5V1J2_9PROT|nr:PilZ domain-containing protein [Algimonas porphyrae]GLQ20937.1 hypothetical protein GCM10007854_18920 [Algimonas porphyrae]